MKLETDRMLLIPLTAEQLRFLVTDVRLLEQSLSFRYDGEPPDEELCRIFRGQIEPMLQARENFVWVTFWMMVLKETKTIMGSINFKNLPGSSGSVEIGYGINLKYGRRGYATEAAGAMVRWALRQPDVRAVTAEVDRRNAASLRVLQKNGFQKFRTAGRFDWYRRTGDP